MEVIIRRLEGILENEDRFSTKIETKGHDNRQNVNICIRKLETNKER
jgi:hypothetical protein